MRHYLLLCILLLTGCASVTPPVPPKYPQQAWQSRQQQLAHLNNWQLKGRIAIHNGVEAWNLNINWRQNHNDYRIELWGPFGAGQVQLKGSQQGVLLTDTDQQVFYASEPEQLLYEHTGVKMPVRGLRYWILGLPDPEAQNHSVEQLDAYGRLSTLQQQDWHVQMKHYARVGEIELPEKLVVNKKDIKVRVVVDDWRVDDMH